MLDADLYYSQSAIKAFAEQAQAVGVGGKFACASPFPALSGSAWIWVRAFTSSSMVLELVAFNVPVAKLRLTLLPDGEWVAEATGLKVIA